VASDLPRWPSICQMARSCSPVTQPLAWHAVTDCSPVFLPLALPFPTRASPPCLRLFVLFANRQYFSTAYLAWRGSPWLARVPPQQFRDFPNSPFSPVGADSSPSLQGLSSLLPAGTGTFRPCPFAPALSPFPLAPLATPYPLHGRAALAPSQLTTGAGSPLFHSR